LSRYDAVTRKLNVHRRQTLGKPSLSSLHPHDASFPSITHESMRTTRLRTCNKQSLPQLPQTCPTKPTVTSTREANAVATKTPRTNMASVTPRTLRWCQCSAETARTRGNTHEFPQRQQVSTKQGWTWLKCFASNSATDFKPLSVGVPLRNMISSENPSLPMTKRCSQCVFTSGNSPMTTERNATQTTRVAAASRA
jgi:hypothetical protein